MEPLEEESVAPAGDEPVSTKELKLKDSIASDGVLVTPPVVDKSAALSSDASAKEEPKTEK